MNTTTENTTETNPENVPAPVALVYIAKHDRDARVRNRAPMLRLAVRGLVTSDVEPIDFGHGELEKHGYRYELSSYGVMLCDHYTDAEIAERKRLNAMVPLQHGDIVQDQDGRLFQVNVRGQYSDAGFLKPMFEPEFSQHMALHKNRNKAR